jgi:hypothetical protein
MTHTGYHAPATGSISTGKFEGFNPSIWNEHKWYECNCGINPDTPPTTAPETGLLLGNRT